jgi:hypothetical protein
MFNSRILSSLKVKSETRPPDGASQIRDQGKGGWSVYAGQSRFSIHVDPEFTASLTGRFHQGRWRSGCRLFRRRFPSNLLRRCCPMLELLMTQLAASVKRQRYR